MPLRTTTTQLVRHPVTQCLFIGVSYYVLTTAVVALGIPLGIHFIRSSVDRGADQGFTKDEHVILQRLSHWDGQWYVAIAREGYTYDPNWPSGVAFFPAYPMTVRLLTSLTGLTHAFVAVALNQILLVLSFAVFYDYARLRYGGKDLAVHFSLLAFGLFPATFFMRMAYTETLFVLSAMLALYAIQRDWPPVFVALTIGFSMAVRAVAAALVPLLVIYVWQQAKPGWRRWGRLVVLVPVALWGLFAYMIFLHVEYGNALAFARSQQTWMLRPTAPMITKLNALATLEPFWAVYQPNSPAFWLRHGQNPSVWFSLQFANPLIFGSAIILVSIGLARKWLNWNEFLLSAGLLAIPYLSRSFEMCMASHGRFAAVVFPMYLVWGQLLKRAPLPMAVGVLGLFSVYLCVYTALFVAGYFLL